MIQNNLSVNDLSVIKQAMSLMWKILPLEDKQALISSDNCELLRCYLLIGRLFLIYEA